MNRLQKPFRQKSDQKIKNSTNQSQIAACEQKKHKRECEFLDTHLSHFFKYSEKKLRQEKRSFFKSKSCSINCTVTYFQTLEEILWFLRLKKPEQRQKFSKKNFEKKAGWFNQQIAKIFDIKRLKNYSMANKNCQ